MVNYSVPVHSSSSALRYFVLENGSLTYGKTPGALVRGHTRGRIDVGCAVISAKTEMLRIDIDEEECIHHIKVYREGDQVVLRFHELTFSCRWTAWRPSPSGWSNSNNIVYIGSTRLVLKAKCFLRQW